MACMMLLQVGVKSIKGIAGANLAIVKPYCNAIE